MATLLVGSQADDSNVHPRVTRDDVRILQRAEQILDSPAKWNRNDNRICPADAKTLSLYCAIERATDEITGHFAHRRAAMQEARFVIDPIAEKRHYQHRLMNYNNDPTTTLADIQHVLRTAEANVERELAHQGSPPAKDKER
jgi:hypothetical protein